MTVLKPSPCMKPMALMVVTSLLAACGPGWGISQVLINPQPVGGESVNPVVVIAESGGRMHDVEIVVRINRSSDFSGPVMVRVDAVTDTNRELARFTIGASSIRGAGVFLRVRCDPTGPGRSLMHVLDAAGQQVNLIDGDAEITMPVRVSVTSQSNIGSNDWPVTWNVPKPLEVTCLRDSPIN